MNINDLVNATMFNTIEQSNKKALTINNLGEVKEKDKDEKEHIINEKGEVIQEDTMELSSLVQDVVNEVIEINMNNSDSKMSESNLSKEYLSIADDELKKIGELSKLTALYKNNFKSLN